MHYAVTLAVVFDTKKTKNPEEGIVKIRVTYRRISRIFTTGIKLNKDVWQRLQKTGPILEGRIKDEEFIKLHHSIYGWTKRDGQRVEGWMDKYQKVIDQLGPDFSFAALKLGIETYGMVRPRETPADVLVALEAKKSGMDADGRIGHSLIYGTVANSLRRFLESMPVHERAKFGVLPKGKKDADWKLGFRQVTPTFLTAYEKWMEKSGKVSQDPNGKPGPASTTTIGIYTRHLRVVFNDAIREKLISRDDYPFGKGRYVIHAGENPKKALSRDEIERIKGYVPENESEQRAHDLWLFTYYSNGLNMTDICLLQWKNFDWQEGSFSFLRTKTKTTSKASKKMIKVLLRDETLRILERWGTRKVADNYVFPFLSHTMTPREQHMAIHQICKMSNKWMKRIGLKLGISLPLVTYSARHSFATTLLRTGTPLKVISDSLGHNSILTTEKYLAGFENEELKKFFNNL